MAEALADEAAGEPEDEPQAEPPAETVANPLAIPRQRNRRRRLIRNFNDYLGAGVLGGTSHLYRLATTRELRPLVEAAYDGPLYTRDFRNSARLR